MDKVRVTVIGGSGVGKTALVRSWCCHPFLEGVNSQTVDTETYSKNTTLSIPGKREVGVCAYIQDFQGSRFEERGLDDAISFTQDEIKTLKDANCIVIVFSASDRKSFVIADFLARNAIHAKVSASDDVPESTFVKVEVSKKRRKNSLRNAPTVPIILVANKNDLDGREYFQAQSLATKLRLPFFATSAKSKCNCCYSCCISCRIFICD